MMLNFLWIITTIFLGILAGLSSGNWVTTSTADLTPDLWQRFVQVSIISACTMWGLAYQGDIIALAKAFKTTSAAKTRERGNHLTTGIKLFAFAFAATLGAFMTASFAANVIKETVRGDWRLMKERQLEFWPYPYPVSTNGPDWKEFNKVSWHFFFQDGKLKKGSKADKNGNCENNLSKDGIHFTMGGKTQTSEEIETILRNIIMSVSWCRSDTPDKVENPMLTFAAFSSLSDWKYLNDGKPAFCTNSTDLNTKQAEERTDEIKRIFIAARDSLAKDPQNAQLQTWLSELELAPMNPTSYIDFDDGAYHKAKGDKRKPSPYDIRQSAVIVLSNPEKCSKPNMPERSRL